MDLNNWYTFEDDEHSYGYTLFCPLKIEQRRFGEYIYGIAIICSDNEQWNQIIVGPIDTVLVQGAIWYYDRHGNQPSKRRIIQSILERDLRLSFDYIR